jgi:hypothetical protein
MDTPVAPTSPSSTSTDSYSSWVERLEPSAEGERAPYRSYSEVWRLARTIAGDSRGRMTVREIGRSHEQEPLWAFDLAPATDSASATVFVVAGIHAMEHVGVATALSLLQRAVETEGPWLQHRLVVVPMANPDGFRAVERMLAKGHRKFIRKNARGVDLNRNFSVGWDDSYYLNRLLRPIFSPGDSPLSEPETQAIDELLSDIRPNYAVSLHAFGRWIFTPFAGSADRPREHERLIEIANGMRACQPDDGYRVMQLGRRSRLFKACGAEIDHFYGRHGALSFLIEIGSGPRLSAPSTWLVPYGWFTPPAELLERDVANVVPAIEYLATLD